MAKTSALRVHRGERTQASIAAEAGIGLSRYNQIETGRTRFVRPDVARRVAEAIGKPMEALFLPSAYMIRGIKSGQAPPHTLD